MQLSREEYEWKGPYATNNITTLRRIFQCKGEMGRHINLSPSTKVHWQDHGVSPDFVQAFSQKPMGKETTNTYHDV